MENMAETSKSLSNNHSSNARSSLIKAIYDNVNVCHVSDEGLQPIQGTMKTGVRVEISGTKQEGSITVSKGTQVVEQFNFGEDAETVKVGGKAFILSSKESSYMFCFSAIKDVKSFEATFSSIITRADSSVFTQRTEQSSAEQYFQFYGYLSQQQNMMQDYIRTATYQRAMLNNGADFQNKIVLDVGAGSGILSFFAIQAGAQKVYAIEASSMAQQCQTLVKNNGLEDRIIVISGKVEEVEVPEPVDVIISEPMGYMLFNERMLESYLHAKKWLKPSGKMYPARGDLHIAPFTDEALYMEQCSKANFWYQPSFHNVDLTSLRETAVQEYFRQPIVDTFDIRICLARSHKYTVDFESADETDLYNIDIPVSFVIAQAGTIHGLAFWFDVAFLGSQSTVWLSTAPTQPLTHWYQVRCLLQTPIFVKQGQQIVGKVLLKCNKRQSYDVEISLAIPGTTIKSYNILDLKNPLFRYTGQPPQPPPNVAGGAGDSTWNTNDVTMQPVDNLTGGVSNGVVTPDAFNIALLNGGMGDGAQQLLQQVAVVGDAPNNASAINALICNQTASIGSIVPVHPGSIPSPGVSSINSAQIINSNSAAPGTDLPILLVQSSTGTAGVHGLIGNQYLIGDYLVQSANSILPISAENRGIIN